MFGYVMASSERGLCKGEATAECATTSGYGSFGRPLQLLVRGGIKTTILLTSNVASYFDKVTALVMAIGRT